MSDSVRSSLISRRRVLWLSGAVQLTDLTYLGPEMARWWPLVRAVEYGPLLLLLALSAYHLLAHRSQSVDRSSI